MTKQLLILIICILSNNAFGQKSKIPGYYISNYAELGFFVTQIELFEDSTFKYEFSGDLFLDRVKGKYRVKKDTIYFDYYPEQIDTTTYTFTDSTGEVFSFKKPKMPNYTEHLRPHRLRYKKGKLYAIKTDSQISTKKNIMKRRTKKYYLIKRNESINRR
jgi:hypothetical protein